MTTFEKLMTTRPGTLNLPEVQLRDDPLRVVDVLREAQILDVRCECVTQYVGILLEMRMAFAGGDHRAALIVGRGMSELTWECPEPRIRDAYSFGMAWYIVDSRMTNRGRSLRIELSCNPGTRLQIVARGFEYYLAGLPDLSLAPPNYGEGPDERVRRDLSNWGGPLAVVGSSRRFADREPEGS